MSATRTSTSIAPTRKVKAYTNTGTNAVVVTLSLVSEDSTANPQVSVKIDNTQSYAFDYEVDDSSVSQLVNNGFWLGFTNSAFTPTFGDTSTKGSLGGRNIRGANGSDYETSGYNNSYPFDPYFIAHPEEAGMGSDWTYMASIKNSGGTVYHFSDISGYSNADWQTMLSGTPNTVSPAATANYNPSYYDNSNGGTMHCPYYGFTVSFQSNGYSTMTYPYNNANAHNQNRSSNGWIYASFSGANPNNYIPDISSSSGAPSGTSGWWWSGSHGIYLYNASRYSGGYYRLFDTTGVLGDTRYAGSSTVTTTNIEDLINSSYSPVRIRATQNENNANYLVYNPWEQKYYIRFVGSTAGNDVDGLVQYHKGTRVAGNVTGRVTTGDTDYPKSTSWGNAFTVVSTNSGSNGIPQGEFTTRPICVGYKIWVCKSTSGTVYFSNDIINWKELSAFDTFAPTGYTMLNEIGSLTLNNQVRYYGKSSSVTKRLEDGWSAVPSAGTLENKTTAGNFERTAIIVPAGDCLYVNNHHPTASVACNVLAVSL